MPKLCWCAVKPYPLTYSLISYCYSCTEPRIKHENPPQMFELSKCFQVTFAFSFNLALIVNLWLVVKKVNVHLTVGYWRGLPAPSTAERSGGWVAWITELPLLYAGLRRLVRLWGWGQCVWLPGLRSCQLSDMQSPAWRLHMSRLSGQPPGASDCRQGRKKDAEKDWGLSSDHFFLWQTDR